MRWPRSFSEANTRRGELIDKTFQGELTTEEKREWVVVDTMVGLWIDYKHPFNYAKLEELEAMVERMQEGREPFPRPKPDRT